MFCPLIMNRLCTIETIFGRALGLGLVGGFLLSTHLCLAESAPPTDESVAATLFAAFDTETTGLSPKKDRIVELGVVLYRDGEIIGKKQWLVNPGIPIPWYATRAHGIDDEMVKDAPIFADILEEFEVYIGDAVLIAHNARFDINFVNAEYQRLDRTKLSNAVLDSLKLFKTWFPGLDSYRLASVAEHTRVAGETYHRALADSVYVARIFDLGLEKFNPDSFDELTRQSGELLRF